jgi:hypothetical protein
MIELALSTRPNNKLIFNFLEFEQLTKSHVQCCESRRICSGQEEISDKVKYQNELSASTGSEDVMMLKN